MTTSLRLSLFIDAQNTYRGARDRFFPGAQSVVDGQFNPMELGRIIASRGGPRGMPCALSEVRIYSGRPDVAKAPGTYAAHMNQCNRWVADGAVVIPRALRYPRSWPNEPAQEKGVDVALAIDFVAHAIDGRYDVGVIMSTDTDILPALELVHSRFPNGPRVAVAAWRGAQYSPRLSLRGSNVWCHWLSQVDYNAVADRNRY